MTEDELAELAELRRRAYGPDADIALDAPAQARLAVLEAAARAERVGPTFGAPPTSRARADDRGSLAAPADQQTPVAPAAAPEDPRDDASGPSARRSPAQRRRTALIVGGVCAAAVLVLAGIALWTRSPSPPAASATRSATPSPTALDVACGDGWGPQAAGAVVPPNLLDVVWSPQWDTDPVDGPTVLATRHGSWVGRLTPVFAPGSVASVVQVTEPASARIVTFAHAQKVGDGFSSSDYADPDAMVAAARAIVPVPECSSPDTYPILVIAPTPTCVHLRITVAAHREYDADVALGPHACS